MLETKFCPNCHCPYDASLPECPVCKRSAMAAAKKARQEDLNDALHGEKREALHQLLTSKLRTGQDDDQDATVIADDPPEAEAPDQGDEAAPAAAEQVTDNQALLDEMLPGDPEEDAPPEAPEGDPVPPVAGPDHPPRKGGKSPVGKVVLAVLIVALGGLLCFGGYALLSSSNGGTGTAGSSGAASSESGAQDSQADSASETQGEDAQEDGTQEDESQTEGEAAENGADAADGADDTSFVDGTAGETGTDQTGDGDANSETDPDTSAEGDAETETPDADEGGETTGDSGAEAENGNTDSNTSEENSNTDSLSSDNAQPETANTGADADDTTQAAA